MKLWMVSVLVGVLASITTLLQTVRFFAAVGKYRRTARENSGTRTAAGVESALWDTANTSPVGILIP